jgi:hypothetical protein
VRDRHEEGGRCHAWVRSGRFPGGTQLEQCVAYLTAPLCLLLEGERFRPEVDAALRAALSPFARGGSVWGLSSVSFVTARIRDEAPGSGAAAPGCTCPCCPEHHIASSGNGPRAPPGQRMSYSTHLEPKRCGKDTPPTLASRKPDSRPRSDCSRVTSPAKIRISAQKASAQPQRLGFRACSASGDA